MNQIGPKLKKLFFNKFVGVFGILIILSAFFYLNFFVFEEEPNVFPKKEFLRELPVNDVEKTDESDSSKIAFPIPSVDFVQDLLEEIGRFLPVS